MERHQLTAVYWFPVPLKYITVLMHASGKHGGAVVEAVPAVEYKLYERRFIWDLVVF